MLKRILATWAVANFAIVGAASWMAGGWYLGWDTGPGVGMMAELGLIMVPNLLLPLVVLGHWWPEDVGSVRNALGWRWSGPRALGAGLLGFLFLYALSRASVAVLGAGIPYHVPGAAGEGVAIRGALDLLRVLAVLVGLLAFAAVTVAAEETMFRGWAQTQVGKGCGPWAGLVVAALPFGLRHLPADLFYARLWQATPQMWLSRQLQLYGVAVGLGLARHFGKSTYGSALAHGLLFVVVLFGIG